MRACDRVLPLALPKRGARSRDKVVRSTLPAKPECSVMFGVSRYVFSGLKVIE